MNIIALLLCFGIDKYWPPAQRLRQYHKLERFWEYLYRQFFASTTWHPVLILGVAFAPLLVTVGLIQLFFNSIFYGILGFLFNVGILFYCLGSVNFREQLETYFTAKEQSAYQEAADSLNAPCPPRAPIEDNQTLTQYAAQSLLINTSQQVYAVIFWYLFLGAFGALFYRLALQMKRHSQNINGSYGFLNSSATILQGWLEWVPARLLALSCALAGNFVSTFTLFFRYFSELPPHNDTLVVECGLAALNLGPTSAGSSIDEQAVIDLIERSIVVVLVSVALMTLGACIN